MELIMAGVVFYRTITLIMCLRFVNNLGVLGPREASGSGLGFAAARFRRPGPALWLALVLSVRKW